MPAIDPKAGCFTCARCGGHFLKQRDGWSQEEAEQELETKFPGTPLEECVEVCDDCWRVLMAYSC